MVQNQNAFGSHFLHTAHIDAFGNIFQRNIGPFTEGLNVVYGHNEAGKTTVNAFVGGVLFGWPEARGGRNAYKPAGAQRAGTLIFQPRTGQVGQQAVECTRDKNAEGIKPHPQPFVLDDIDEETYRTIFALNSDELLSLGRGSDITAHLLTAGAGTATSPAQALNDVNARIAACFSNAAQYQDSLTNLQAEQEHISAALDAAAEEAECYKQQAREFDQLGPQLEDVQARLVKLNADIDVYTAQAQAIEQLLSEEAALEEEHEALVAREAELGDMHAAGAESLPHLDNARLRSLSEDLNDLMVREVRLTSDYQQASDDHARARSAYTSLVESEAAQKQEQSRERNRQVLTVLNFVIPALFAIAALFLFVLARDSESTPALVMAAIFGIASLAFAGALPVLLARQGKRASGHDQALEQAIRVLNEAEARLNTAVENKDAHEAQVAHVLESQGLAAAEGNLRYARALLDDARQARSNLDVWNEQRLNVQAQRVRLDAARNRIAEDLSAAYQALGLAQDVSLLQVRAQLQDMLKLRQALQEEAHDLATRHGQLKNELERAQHLQSFDQLKIKDAQLRTRMDETKAEYAKLLLVRRLLEEAIAAWEEKSQPEVYRQASSLFSLMTGGAWCEVRMDESDKLVVVDAFGQAREPHILSTGTCQQLYLALRIALLMTAENVGRNMPILADDILVNFDAKRRVGAAQALEALSHVRQVIVFTCHEEVVRLMQDSCTQANVVVL